MGFSQVTVTLFHSIVPSLPYHISSVCRHQPHAPVVPIPLQHPICAVNDKSSHATLLGCQSCNIPAPCDSLSAVLSPPLSPPPPLLHLAPSTGCICSGHAQFSFPVCCSVGVTDAEWRLTGFRWWGWGSV